MVTPAQPVALPVAAPEAAVPAHYKLEVEELCLSYGPKRLTARTIFLSNGENLDLTQW